MTGKTLTALALVALLVAGCGISSSGVSDVGDAPTGVAPGTTLYFLDRTGALRPALIPSGRLGSVNEALDLLLHVPGVPAEGLHTEVPHVSSLGPAVTATDRLVTVRLPLAAGEVSDRAIDQVVCTILGVRKQAGAPRGTEVVLEFTVGRATGPRGCPVLG